MFKLQPFLMPHSGFRFADESSSVIHAGITPPDDGSSLAMSASDFRVSTPTRACQESQLSMTSPSSTMSPLRTGANHYLYGRPLNLTAVGQLNVTSESHLTLRHFHHQFQLYDIYISLVSCHMSCHVI